MIFPMIQWFFQVSKVATSSMALMIVFCWGLRGVCFINNRMLHINILFPSLPVYLIGTGSAVTDSTNPLNFAQQQAKDPAFTQTSTTA